MKKSSKVIHFHRWKTFALPKTWGQLSGEITNTVPLTIRRKNFDPGDVSVVGEFLRKEHSIKRKKCLSFVRSWLKKPPDKIFLRNIEKMILEAKK